MHKWILLLLLLAPQAHAQTSDRTSDKTSDKTSDTRGFDHRPANPISFAEAYNSILGRSIRLETQRLRVEESRERRRQSYGTFLPSVSAAYSENRGDTLLGTRREAALVGQVNLFRSGADVAGIKASQRSLESQTFSLAREEQNAQADAAEALIQFIARDQLVAIGKKLVEVRTDSVRIARERFSKGLLPQQEVDKTAIDLDIARSRLADSLVEFASAQARLEAALGHANIRIEWPWKESLMKKADVEVMTFDLEKRHDWKAALSTTESEKWQRRRAFATLLPSIDLKGSFGNADLSETGRRDWSAILTLSVPLFDGFTTWGNYKIQGLEERRAGLALETIRREAPAEVASLRQSYQFARDSALAREKTAQVTSRLYNDNLQRFRLGRASANDLEIDQSRLLDSQQLEVQGWLTAHLSYLRLCHSLGGFVDPAGSCRMRESTN